MALKELLICSLVFDTIENIESLEMCHFGGALIKGIDGVEKAKHSTIEYHEYAQNYVVNGPQQEFTNITSFKDNDGSIRLYPQKFFRPGKGTYGYLTKMFNSYINLKGTNYVPSISVHHVYTKIPVVVWYIVDIDNQFFQSQIRKYNIKISRLNTGKREIFTYSALTGMESNSLLTNIKRDMILRSYGGDYLGMTYDEWNRTKGYRSGVPGFQTALKTDFPSPQGFQPTMLCNNACYYMSCYEFKKFLEQAEEYNKMMEYTNNINRSKYGIDNGTMAY